MLPSGWEKSLKNKPLKEDKKIEKIGKSFKTNCLNDDIQKQIETVQHNCALVASKIDELIDEVNTLKSGKNDC